jgi:hypothetical protein
MATTGRIGWAGATVAALGVNAAVLALLSMEGRGARTQRPLAVGPILYLDIEPAPPPIRPAAPASPLEPKDDGDGAFPSPSTPSRAIDRAADTDERASDMDKGAPAALPAGLSREWLARRDSLLAHGAPSVRAPRHGPPNCAWPETLAPAEQRRCRGLALAQVDPRDPPLQASGDEDRTSGFAREAAAKKRWRDYRSGEGDYPGLRSLFGKN